MQSLRLFTAAAVTTAAATKLASQLNAAADAQSHFDFDSKYLLEQQYYAKYHEEEAAMRETGFVQRAAQRQVDSIDKPVNDKLDDEEKKKKIAMGQGSTAQLQKKMTNKSVFRKNIYLIN